MGDPLEGVNGIFYISIATLLCTGISLSIKYCYKSKCKQVELCNCIKIIRDVDVEQNEDLTLVKTSSSEEKFRL